MLSMWFKSDPSQLLRKWPYRSLENFGTYCTLYCLAWDNQGLPDNPQTAAQLSGLPESTIQPAWEVFRQHCTEYMGRLMPVEMVEGIRAYRDRIEAGKRGAKHRWTENKGLTDADANSHPMVTQWSPNGNTNADIDLDLEREKDTHTQSADVCVPLSASQTFYTPPRQTPATPEAAALYEIQERLRQRIGLSTMLNAQNEKSLLAAAATVLENYEPEHALRAVDAFFDSRRKPQSLSYLAENFAKWAMEQG